MNGLERNLRQTVLHGVVWNAGYQVFAAALQLGAMVVVTRIVPPEQYGQWAVALGILQFLNALNIANFLAHALQEHQGQQPNWTLHWHAGNLIQGSLMVGCIGIAVSLHGNPHYEGVSILLGIASVGILLNTPAQIRTVMLQRQLSYRRLRTITAIASLVGASSIVIGAVAGYGARAMVLGGNVLISIPYVVDLLLVERWRPVGRWFAWPDLSGYQESLIFGANRAGAAILASSRGALSSALMPATLGFGSMGLMNRAEGLFAMSAGRVLSLVSETVYPVLPQIAGDEPRFARIARGYAVLMATLVLAAFGLFAACGRDLSRVMYGDRWAGADPLLLPGSLIGLAAALTTVGNQILLAKGRLRDVFILELAPRLMLFPAFFGVLTFGWSMVAFHWGVAVPLALGAVSSLIWAGRRLPGQRLSSALAAPAIAAAGAWLGAALVGGSLGGSSPALRCGAQFLIFAIVWLLLLRCVFPSALREMLTLLPGGVSIAKVLRLENRNSS